MVKASGQIEQELRVLQDQTELMSSSLDPLYEGYLKALSDAGHRQLVMAAYYLCTQAYPDRFLALSWDDRNRLQQSLQVLSTQISEQLNQQRVQAKKLSRQRQNSDGLAFLQRLLESRMASAAGKKRVGKLRDDERFSDTSSRKQNRSTADLFDADEEDFIPSAEDDLEARAFEGDSGEDSAFDISALDMDDEHDDAPADALDVGDGASVSDRDGRDRADDEMDFEMEVPAADERLSLDEEEDLLAALEGLARRSMAIRGETDEDVTSNGETTVEADDEDPEEEEEQPLTPVHLVRQQMLLDRSIRDVFKAISAEANELLQKANVMPSFPRSLLAAATDSGGLGEPANAVPNVVRVSVRVMHGEAMLEAEEEDGLNEDDSPRSKRSNRAEDANSSDADRRDSDSDSQRERSRASRQGRSSRDRESQRRRLRRSDVPRSDLSRSERSARRGKGRRSQRIIPQDIIEIESLPELAAISLRLSEVEFTDPTVSAWRSRLRQKLGELKKLGVRYRKTQRSLETAQAEDAWRSSWTVHNPDANV